MKGFGYFNQFEGLKDLADKTAQLPEIQVNPLTADQEEDIDNVSVPTLDRDEYKPSANKAMGSAGNTVDGVDQDADPQLGCAKGIADSSIGLSKGMSMAQTESFDRGEVVDEDPVDTAKERTEDNVIEKTRDMFEEMFGKSYAQKSKEKDYDLDFTKPNVVISDEPVSTRKIKKGW